MSWLDRVFGDETPDYKAYRSPSDVAMYLRCPRSWFYRYAENLRIPPSAAMTQGIAVHAGAETDLGLYIATREHLTVEEVEDATATAFTDLEPETRFERGEDPGELKDQAVRLARLWRIQLAPQIEPVSVESWWETDVNGILFKGRYDVVTPEGPRDLKTTGRSPQADAVNTLQARAYALGFYETSKELAPIPFDFLVKNKIPKLVTHTFEPQPLDLEIVRDQVMQTEGMIQAGYFPRNTDGWHCSEKWCGYWAECMGKHVERDTFDMKASD